MKSSILVRASKASLLVVACASVLAACSSQKANYRPAPNYTKPSTAQSGPTYTQPTAPQYAPPAAPPAAAPSGFACGKGKCG